MSASPLGVNIEISAPLNAALIIIVTIFFSQLDQNARGTSMQTMKQPKYISYLDFFILFALLKIIFHSSFERKNHKVLTFNIVHFHNFEITSSL